MPTTGLTLISPEIFENVRAKMNAYIMRKPKERDMIIIFSSDAYVDRWKIICPNAAVHTEFPLVPIPENCLDNDDQLGLFINQLMVVLSRYFHLKKPSNVWYCMSMERSSGRPQIHLLFANRDPGITKEEIDIIMYSIAATATVKRQRSIIREASYESDASSQSFDDGAQCSISVPSLESGPSEEKQKESSEVPQTESGEPSQTSQK